MATDTTWPTGKAGELPGERMGTLGRRLWRLIAVTFRVCMRYRVTGLAAEAGFFALLSLPPLVLGLVGSVGFFGQWVGSDVLTMLHNRVEHLAGTFLTTDAVKTVVLPTFDQVVHRPRLEFASVGYVLSLWAGSRALNVYVDTISIMYGLGGRRGIVRTRALSFSLYVASLVLAVVIVPLVLLGPALVSRFVDSAHVPVASGSASRIVYWLAVIAIAVLALVTLYHVATPVRSRWRRDLPGAVLALGIWVVTSFVLRDLIAESVGGPSIYGPLATPIVLLIWLYFLAIAVLIGAALNAAFDEVFPRATRLLGRGTGSGTSAGPPADPAVPGAPGFPSTAGEHPTATPGNPSAAGENPPSARENLQRRILDLRPRRGERSLGARTS